MRAADDYALSYVTILSCLLRGQWGSIARADHPLVKETHAQPSCDGNGAIFEDADLSVS